MNQEKLVFINCQIINNFNNAEQTYMDGFLNEVFLVTAAYKFQKFTYVYDFLRDFSFLQKDIPTFLQHIWSPEKNLRHQP